MRSKVISVPITLIILLPLTQSSTTASITDGPKLKRSPLEIGYVQFTIPSPSHHSLHHDVTIHLPSVVVHRTNTSVEHHADKHMLTMAHVQYRDEWIPGHVVNHIFIPGKIQHVLVPVVTHPVHAVLVHSVHVPVYRKPIGGFGVGIDSGGRGAGHGFHVL